MKLIVFDIDGTLTNTTSIEDRCFFAAFEEIYGLDISGVEWHTLPHVTDQGIVTHLLREAWGREAEQWEIQPFHDLFLEKLAEAKRQFPYEFGEVPGGAAFFHQLNAMPEVQLAIATGAWSGSARFKLNGIGIDPNLFPFAHSDNFTSRTDITQSAIDAADALSPAGFSQVIYFGDGLWDFHTCKDMNLTFVGIDCKRSGRLKAAGAPLVFPNFLDQEAIFSALGQF